MFTIRFGVPEMKVFWDDILQRKKTDQLSKDEEKLFTLLGKTLKFLRSNPKHPGLNSHEIEVLSNRYRIKVFQSYLENRTPSAGRMYWVYGPNRKEITSVGLEPYPEDKKRGAYDRIKFSNLPKE